MKTTQRQFTFRPRPYSCLVTVILTDSISETSKNVEKHLVVSGFGFGIYGLLFGLCGPLLRRL